MGINLGTCCCVVGCAHITFNVRGCNSLILPAGDVSVSITDGTTTYTGSCNSSGAFVTPNLTSGTWNYTISCSRFTTATGSTTIACPQSNVTVNKTLVAATGYQCLGGCAYPLLNTLTYTDSKLGATGTLVANGVGWLRDYTLAIMPACGGCAATTNRHVEYLFITSAGSPTLETQWPSNTSPGTGTSCTDGNGINVCPGQCTTAFWSPSPSTCYTSTTPFSMTFSITGQNYWCTSTTITITE